MLQIRNFTERNAIKGHGWKKDDDSTYAEIMFSLCMHLKRFLSSRNYAFVFHSYMTLYITIPPGTEKFKYSDETASPKSAGLIVQKNVFIVL